LIVLKKRADVLLVERGLVESRTKAQRLILAGEVFLKDGRRVEKPSEKLDEDCEIYIRRKLPYVSRAGLKLETAIKEFNIDVANKVCLDVGSSTGGFTDCLLKYGAKKVYATDVGKGLLDWKLRNDSRVVVLEGINFRYFDVSLIDECLDVVTVDVSFISLLKLTEKFAQLIEKKMNPSSIFILLVKPQFEVGKEIADRFKGILPEDVSFEVALSVKNRLSNFFERYGYTCKGMVASSIKGDKGNQEYLVMFYNQ